VQIDHGNWRGDHEPNNPSDGRAAPILGREPLQLGQTSYRRRDAEETSDDGSGEEPGFPCCGALKKDSFHNLRAPAASSC